MDDTGAEPIPMEYATELIKGERFNTPDGRTFVIGWSEDVQTALKIPFRAFIDMNNRMDDQNKLINDLRKNKHRQVDKISFYQNLGFWARFKTLFTGMPK